MSAHTDVVFDGPPGPESGRFVEVEDDSGKSVRLGEWHQRGDGYWVLRLQGSPATLAAAQQLLDACTAARDLGKLAATAAYSGAFPPGGELRAKVKQIEAQLRDALAAAQVSP